MCQYSPPDVQHGRAKRWDSADYHVSTRVTDAFWHCIWNVKNDVFGSYFKMVMKVVVMKSRGYHMIVLTNSYQGTDKKLMLEWPSWPKQLAILCQFLFDLYLSRRNRFGVEIHPRHASLYLLLCYIRHFSLKITFCFRFFVSISVYCIVGCSWNCIRGYKGVELLPQGAFWIDLPVLIAVSNSAEITVSYCKNCFHFQ